jgi:hypothetical protein
MSLGQSSVGSPHDSLQLEEFADEIWPLIIHQLVARADCEAPVEHDLAV